MQFLLSLIGDEPNFDEITPEEMQAQIDTMNTYNLELEKAGAFFLGGGLQERSQARTVRFDGDDIVVSDGPFAETKEQLMGFWIIDCANMEEALEWTRKVPMGGEGVIEVRPFAHELEGKPSDGTIPAAELLEGVQGNAPASS